MGVLRVREKNGTKYVITTGAKIDQRTLCRTIFPFCRRFTNLFFFLLHILGHFVVVDLCGVVTLIQSRSARRQLS